MAFSYHSPKRLRHRLYVFLKYKLHTIKVILFEWTVQCVDKCLQLFNCHHHMAKIPFCREFCVPLQSVLFPFLVSWQPLLCFLFLKFPHKILCPFVPLSCMFHQLVDCFPAYSCNKYFNLSYV